LSKNPENVKLSILQYQQTIMKTSPMNLKAIGVIHSPHKQEAGTPIQPRWAEHIEGRVEVFPEYAAGLKDLDGFERIWLICWLDRAAPAPLTVKPYLDDVPRGIFATRAPSRPNPIGLSAVRLLKVEGRILHVAGLDILDQTPLLDLKPYAPEFDCYAVERVGWLGRRQSGQTKADQRFSRENSGPAKSPA
jgi:tRNA-Thr(GGU) m(6)t(6)A37 methyltransferase TsaA